MNDDGLPPWFVDFCVGGFAAFVAKTVAAPVERLKIIFQTQNENKLILDGSVKRHKNMLQTIGRLTKDHGVLSWWRGNLPNVIRYVPQQAITFGTKDVIRARIVPDKKEGTTKVLIGNIVAGALAGNIALTLIYPLDFIRNRLGADLGKNTNREFTGMYQCVKSIVATDGIHGIYRGLGASWVCYAVYRGLLFGLYDTFKQKDVSFGKKWLTGYLCTGTAMVVAHPLETVRRRMMMTSGRLNKQHYKHGFDCFKTILIKEGLVKGLYAGLIPNLIRSIPSQSLVLALVDQIKQNL